MSPSRRYAIAALVLFIALGAAVRASETQPAPQGSATAPAKEHPSDAATPSPQAGLYPVPPPPFTEGYFPCSNCHVDIVPNPERRELKDEHTNIVLNHGPRERWCFDCHNPDNRDVLRLASGTLVPFEESYRLCGQCHGDKLRDWKVGVHGKRTGMWNGEKQYLLCAHCHNPHSPHFAPIEPMPPPPRPSDIR